MTKRPPAKSGPKLGRKPYVTPEMRQNCADAILQWREEIGRNSGREGPATQQEFAELLGVRVYDVSDWEQAKRLPGRDTAFRLGDLLGVDPRAVLLPRPPHLARHVRLRAFLLKVIPDLAVPELVDEAMAAVDAIERRNSRELDARLAADAAAAEESLPRRPAPRARPKG